MMSRADDHKIRKVTLEDDELTKKLQHLCAAKLNTFCKTITIKAIGANYEETLGYAIINRNSTRQVSTEYSLPIPGIILTLQSRYMSGGKLICQIFDARIYADVQAELLKFAQEYKVGSLELTRGF